MSSAQHELIYLYIILYNTIRYIILNPYSIFTRSYKPQVKSQTEDSRPIFCNWPAFCQHEGVTSDVLWLT